METQIFIQELIDRTNRIINKVEEFKRENPQALNYKMNPDNRSALECIEHLNLYGDFYNPEINKRLQNNNSSSKPEYKGTWLGNYFVKSAEPITQSNPKKMKTFKDKDPNGSNLAPSVLDRL